MKQRVMRVSRRILRKIGLINTKRAPHIGHVGIFLLLLVGMTMVYGLTIGTGHGVPFQKAPFGRPDGSTLVYCNFNQSSSCLTQTGKLDAVKSNLSIVSTGAFGTKGAQFSGNGSVGIYPNPTISPVKGTVEAWVNFGTETSVKQYVFSALGGKSLNGDLLNDYILGDTGPTVNQETSHIFMGEVGGIETQNPVSFPSQVIRAISAGDIDGDGAIDFVTSNHTANQVWIFHGPFNAGEIAGIPSAGDTIDVSLPQGNVLTDLDGDGDLDLVVASYDVTTVPVYGFENDGLGNFTPLPFSITPFAAPAEGLDVVDVDNDGIQDIIFGSFTGDLSKPSLVMYGQIGSNGKYTIDLTAPNSFEIIDYTILGLSSGDLDGDGWMDIVEAATFNDKIIIRMNDGTGHFPDDAAHKIERTTSRPFTTAIRDIDNDGYLDIGVANYKPGVLADNLESTFFLGPDFVNTKTYAVENAVSLTIGDLDGDGLNDLAMHSSTGGICPVYYLDEDGTISSTLHLACLETFGNAGGPGSGVYGAVKSSTPYGRTTNQANNMELYYDPVVGKIVFAVHDDAGRKHEASVPYTPTGSMIKVQAEWNTNKKIMRLIVGDPSTTGTSKVYKGTGDMSMGGVIPTIHIGTGFENQYPLNGTLDEFRISNVERSQYSTI